MWESFVQKWRQQCLKPVAVCSHQGEEARERSSGWRPGGSRDPGKGREEDQARWGSGLGCDFPQIPMSKPYPLIAALTPPYH